MGIDLEELAAKISAINDAVIRIPARKKEPVQGQQVIRVSEEAYNALVDIYNESTLPMKELASILILNASKRVVFDKEG